MSREFTGDELGAGVSIILVDTPHAFVNTGEEPLGMVAIHVSPRFVTEWLDQSS